MNSAIGFPMPKSIVVDEATMTDTYARFIAQPFQSGFGHTLGNSLRRVLLSSLNGAAISSVRIDGAKHEFDSLDNVVEDVAEIVLNLKKVRLNLYSDEPKKLEIRKDKAGKVTAADIICDSNVEVLNPDQLICTLDKSLPFRAEIEVSYGRGYLPAEKHTEPREIGVIPVDCLFTPVTRVNYQVGAARVGEETEMDSLELEIWTDGRISPRNALEEAARILRDHLQPFMGSQVVKKDVVLSEEEMKLFKLLSHDVETLDLSVRAMNCLNSANIKLISELCTKTESRMLKYRNFGKKSLDEIKEKVEKLGLELGMNLSDRLMAALEVESARVRAEEEENK
ncbi:MAG: DNA-directed RNA polymerase subunit alpha [Lentisphaeria bacterium]|jgi:DNA-directed RNA polymerase subunit alpha|nr:DNA-directed RNA polymerase subunit alpha [Lentisphaeria bacterium]